MAYNNTQEIIWIERAIVSVITIIFLYSVWSVFQYAQIYKKTEREIETKIAEVYNISQEVSASVDCYKGYLHYPNSGAFSGSILLSPSVQCDLKELEELRENPHSFDYYGSLLISIGTLISLLIFRFISVKTRRMRYVESDV